MVQAFRELRLWQDAMALAEAVHGSTRVLPPDERFGLTSQLCRASVYIASCIAAGDARGSTKNYLRFLSMSLGSHAEVETQLLLAQRFGYLFEAALSLLLTQLHGLARQLQALKKALKMTLAGNQISPFPRSPFPAR